MASSDPSGERRVRRRAAKYELEQRLQTIEDMLVAGFNPARIEQQCAGDWGLHPRHIRKYITTIYQHWDEESKRDAPHKREKLVRMAERLFAKAVAAGKYGQANSALTTLAKLGGAFAAARGDRAKVLETLGPPPTDDPTKALIYAQNVLVLSLQDIAADPTMDPERRYRLLADLSAKVGMTHAKALVQSKLDKVTKRLGVAKDKSGGAQSLVGVAKPETARGGARAARSTDGDDDFH